MELVEKSFFPIPVETSTNPNRLIYVRIGDIKSFKGDLDGDRCELFFYDGTSQWVMINSETLLKVIREMYRVALFPPKPKGEKK